MTRALPVVSALAIAALGLVAACAGDNPESVTPASADRPRAGDPEGAEGSSKDTPKREAQLIATALRKVTAARGIRMDGPVPGRVLSRSALLQRVKEHVAREIPPESIRDEGITLKLIGLIPLDVDYEAQEFALLEAQLAGYYEPADKTMYMAADLKKEEAEATLDHELVHALQDAQWDLKTRSKYRPGEGDRSAAVSALAEGDATSAMLDMMIGERAPGKTALDIPEELLVEQLRSGMETGPGASAPHAMRSSLLAPYLYGTLFVAELRRRGGWTAVDDAWNHAPETSEQILHFDKWLAKEPAVAVQAPTFATLGSGFVAADTDTYGELGLRLMLEEWGPAATADLAASGWGGDRAVLVKKGDTAAFAWRIHFDAATSHADAFAQRAFTALAAGVAPAGGGAFACNERPDRGPIGVARNGQDIVLVAGPARTAGTAWTSAGNCASAKAWAQEIVPLPATP